MNTTKIMIAGALIVLAGLVFYVMQEKEPLTQVQQPVTPATTTPPVIDLHALTEVYASSTGSFTISYPKGYTVDETYTYQALGPGKDIAGVRFIIPERMASGTNLSDDSYISVESKSGSQPDVCAAGLFLDLQDTNKEIVMREGNMIYFVASTTDAAAGNRFEESVYVFPSESDCMAIRYFIHYTAIENYDPGTVKLFDRTQLVMDFDAIRKTFSRNK